MYKVMVMFATAVFCAQADAVGVGIYREVVEGRTVAELRLLESGRATCGDGSGCEPAKWRMVKASKATMIEVSMTARQWVQIYEYIGGEGLLCLAGEGESASEARQEMAQSVSKVRTQKLSRTKEPLPANLDAQLKLAESNAEMIKATERKNQVVSVAKKLSGRPHVIRDWKLEYPREDAYSEEGEPWDNYTQKMKVLLTILHNQEQSLEREDLLFLLNRCDCRSAKYLAVSILSRYELSTEDYVSAVQKMTGWEGAKDEAFLSVIISDDRTPVTVLKKFQKDKIKADWLREELDETIAIRTKNGEQ